MKSKGAAYFLWLISVFGWLGFHRFYLGKIGTGIIWIFTGGCFGIGALIDLFTLGGQVEQYNTKEELKTLRATTNEMARMTAHSMAQKNQQQS
jgi:TM2 domain-containing membrane protein YozV